MQSTAKLQHQKTPLIWLAIFLAGYFLFTFLIPSFIYHSLAPDSSEQIAWSHTLSWGYEKHPAMGAWLIGIMLDIFKRRELATFMASATCLITALIYIYKTSRLALSTSSSILATLLSSLSIYYMMGYALKYNANIIMLPFWVMSIYYFERAFRTLKWHYWLALSIVCAAGMLSKYEFSLILLLEFLYAVYHFRRDHLKYIIATLALFIALLLPHIIWLTHHDFAPILYAIRRTSSVTSHGPLYRHIYTPISSVFAILSNSFIALFLLWILLKVKVLQSDGKVSMTKTLFDKKQPSAQGYLMYVAIGPLILAGLIAIVLGIHLQAQWGYAFLPFIVTGFMVALRVRSHRIHWPWVVSGILLIHVVTMSIFTYLEFARPKMHSLNIPGPAITKTAQNYWNEYQPNAPLLFVGGPGSGYTTSVVARLSFKTQYFLLNTITPWINKEDVHNKGALLVLRGCPTQNTPKPIAMYEKIYQSHITHHRCFRVPMANKFKPRTISFSLYIAPPSSQDIAKEVAATSEERTPSGD